MRLTSAILLQCLATLGCTATQIGSLYTFDLDSRQYPSQPRTLSSSTAYSIAARRLGSPERRRLASLRDAELEQIDNMGGRQVPFFSDGRKDTHPPRLVIAIEGHDRGMAQDTLEGVAHLKC